MRILIADDDPAALLLLRSALEDWGYEVVAVSDGIAAWNVLRHVDAPPLALLDWLMPGLDGVDVCRKVRQESEAPFIYLVLLTGKTQKRDIVLGMESGADDYVSKPFDEQELKVRLRAGQRIAQMHEVLLKHATKDALTGICNRKSILEILERELARAKRVATEVGAIMVDVDNFKQVNDTRGHSDGDDALREIARRLGGSLRPSDSVGRYGGEEFLIVLPGCNLASALVAAERIRHAVAATEVSTQSGGIPLTLSLGVAVASGATVGVNELLKNADAALYLAKRGGKNRVCAATTPKVSCQ